MAILGPKIIKNPKILEQKYNIIILLNCNLKLITLIMYILLNSIKMGFCTLKDKANLFASPIFHYQSTYNPLRTSYALYALKNNYRVLKPLLKQGKLDIVFFLANGYKQSMH